MKTKQTEKMDEWNLQSKSLMKLHRYLFHDINESSTETKIFMEYAIFIVFIILEYCIKKNISLYEWAKINNYSISQLNNIMAYEYDYHLIEVLQISINCGKIPKVTFTDISQKNVKQPEETK